MKPFATHFANVIDKHPSEILSGFHQNVCYV